MPCTRKSAMLLVLLANSLLPSCALNPGAPLPAINKDDARCPPSTIELCSGDSDSRIDNETHEEMRFCTCQAAF